MTMLVASTASADPAPLTVTYEKVLCPRYADVPANSEASNIDDTGGFWQELNTSYGSRDTGWTTDPAHDIPAACTKAAGWQFEFMNRQGGDVIGTYTTGSDGTVSVALPDTMGALARGSGLWLREITKPALAGFGSLRCYNDILNGDNLENIAGVPAGVTHIYCIAYNVAGPGITLTKTASASSYGHVGQHITYTYTVINTSNVNIDSAQFTVSDDKINNVPFDCGAPISLTPNHDAPVTAPSAGSWVSCTHDYTVTQADVDHGSITNNATGHFSAGGHSYDSNQASVTLTGPSAAPRITLTKTASPAAYSNAGEPITYTYKIINTGNVTLSSSQFTVSDDKISGGAFNCGSSQALSPNTATIDSPSDGSYVTCTKTYHVTPGDVVNRSVTNTATASGASLTSNTVSATVNLAKLTVTKTPSRTTYTAAGQLINYAYSLTNNGNSTLTGPFTVTDDALGTVTCGNASVTLAPGASRSTTDCGSKSYTTTQSDFDTAKTITNHAYGTGYVGTMAVNSATVTVEVTATGTQTRTISIVKTAAETSYSKVGDTITYHYTIRNTGNVTLGPAQFTVSDNQIGSPKDTAFNCGPATTTLAPNATVTCTATYTVAQADLDRGHVTNVATATVVANDRTITSDPATVTVQAAQGPALGIVKTADQTTFTKAGETIRYTYVLRNTGNVTLGPAQFTVSDDQIGSPKDTAFNCGPATTTLAPNATVTCTATYTVVQGDIDAGSVTNTASASGAGLTSGTDTVTVNGTQGRTIGIDKTAAETSYSRVGDTITYHYTIRNTGNVTLGPAQFTVLDNQIGSPKGTAFNCGSATTTLAPDATVTCDATYTVVQGDIDAGSVTNTASASVADLTSGTDTVTVNGTQGPKITIVKTAAETSYSKVGDTLTYTYKVINTGNVTLGPAQFTVSDDQIGSPKGTPFDCGTPNTLYPNSATLEDPSKGSFLTCTATYTIAQADLDRGHVTNDATATVVANDRTITSDPATVTVQAAQGPALGIVKTADQTTFTKAGETITYTYVLTNTGNVALGEPFTVSDDKINGGTAFTCGAATSLAVGASVTCTATYTVTLADLDAGKVVNTAIGHGRLGETTIDTASQLVTVTLQSLESVRAETATPTHAVTPPPTTTGGGPSGDGTAPFFALMICFAFGGLGLLAVQRQRRTLRR
jgi:uncharacterized repeat protein (TIGR01451 family)